MKSTTIRLSTGAVITVRQERDPIKAVKLAAPFMRFAEDPPTADGDQAVAFAALAMVLAPYVTELDAAALGDGTGTLTRTLNDSKSCDDCEALAGEHEISRRAA